MVLGGKKLVASLPWVSMHKFNSLKFTYVSQEAIQVYVHRRDTVETLQGIAAHQPLGGRWAVRLGMQITYLIYYLIWWILLYRQIANWIVGSRYLGISLETVCSICSMEGGAFTAPIVCLCCIFAYMSDLHVFMLLMEHYLLRGAWAGWEEKGWSSLLRLQDLGKWHSLTCTFATWIDWRYFATSALHAM